MGTLDSTETVGCMAGVGKTLPGWGTPWVSIIINTISVR